MFKRILVAVDGSTTAEQALREAIKLAVETQGKLRIVHAVDIINISINIEFPGPPDLAEALIKHGQTILKNAGEEAKKAGIPFETHLIEMETLGKRIPEAIAEDADNWPADLIVICTHGRKGLSHLFLGSIAEGVVRAATKPVLLIRGK